MLLRENLGQAGEGVASYIKNRQEESRREANAEVYKKWLGTPEGQKMDTGLAPALFESADYRAGPAIFQMLQKHKLTAPERTVHAGKYGGLDVAEFPFGGGEPSFEHFPKGDVTQPWQPTGSMSDNDLRAQDAYNELKTKLKREPTQAEIVARTRELQREDIQFRTGVTSGAAVGRQTGQEKRKREQAGREATALGSQSGPLDTKIGRLRWRLNLPRDDKQIEPPDSPWAGEPSRIGYGPRREEYIRLLQKLEDDKARLEEDLIRKKGEAAEPTSANMENGGWKQHPAGFLYRDLT